MGVTTKGLPYPESTDNFFEVQQHIKDLTLADEERMKLANRS